MLYVVDFASFFTTRAHTLQIYFIFSAFDFRILSDSIMSYDVSEI